MDSEKESSTIPPPPPPPLPLVNAISTVNGRSQLLADIRKGATLKKTPDLKDANHNDLSPSDKIKKQTQDLLQAELTSTLKRRRPIVINEPPKYNYPTYDDGNNNNNNNNSNNNGDSSLDESVNANAMITKPLNANAVLSVVTGIKLPDIQYNSNASTPKSQANDKPKMTHGKPNFTIQPRENKVNVQTGPVLIPKMQNKSPEIVQTKYPLATNPIAKSTSNMDSESLVEKCKSAFLVKSQKSIDNNNVMPKSHKLKSKTELASKYENAVSSKVANPNGKELKSVNSVDETASNGISFVSVANKKALFEKPAQDETTTKTMPLKCVPAEKMFSNKPTAPLISNGKFNSLKSHRTINSSLQKPGVTTVTLNKNVSYGANDGLLPKDRVDRFERTVHTVNETTTTNTLEKYETKQFEQKTFVSFSKDLLNAPNNYPEQIRVKKTIITERSHAIPESPFHNIRFSIQSNGQVIPKPK